MATDLAPIKHLMPHQNDIRSCVGFSLSDIFELKTNSGAPTKGTATNKAPYATPK